VGHRSSLLENLSTSRLVVLTYNETTFPITLSSGYPTIALWREEFLQANGEATEVFRALHQCGIIHHCPIEAATLVAEIWNDVDEWWSSREVRVARDLYTRMFSRRLTDVAKETASALRGDLYSTVR
jgi:putative transferase (TIGR04331 family)